jgi:hypothetical protein
LAKLIAHPRRCNITDLYRTNSPFRVGARVRVERTVKAMMSAGEIVAIECSHPDAERVAARLLVADPQLVPATSGGDVV